MPCLTDRKANCSLAQSGSILEYIAENEGGFLSIDKIERLRIRELILWDFDRLVPNIYRPRARKLGFRPADLETLQMYMNDGHAALNLLDSQLRDKSWLVGTNPTIADVDIYDVVSYAPEAGFDLARYLNIEAWTGLFQSFPGFRSADQLLPRQDATGV